MTTIYINRDTPLPARRKHEHYPTEDRVLIRAALETYALAKGGSPGYILDPGAGDGRWGLAAKALYPGATVHGVELRRVRKPAGFARWWACRDYLKFHPAVRYGLAVGNPAYGPKVDGVLQAERFIRHTWELLAPGGRTIFLLPLQLQAGVGRYHGLWSELPPTLVAVVSPRPSFGLNSKGRRGTNGTDYGLFVWDKTLDGSCAGTPRRWPTELFVYQPEREG
jgi:hypothetical protein